MTALSDAELSRTVAVRTGRMLIALRESAGDIDRTTLRLLGDRSAHELIAAALAEHRPLDVVLSEEAADPPGRLAADRVWIVDPLDGTWEFGQGYSDFGVHIALWQDGTLSAATVDLPALGLTRSVLDAGRVPDVPQDRPLRVVTSRTRPPARLHRTVAALAAHLADAGVSERGVEVIRVGSVGAKVNELLAGRAEAYIHDSGFHEWDAAAPYAVALHYGFRAAHVDGSPLTFNHPDTHVTDMVVSHPSVTEYLQLALREAA